MEPAFASPPFGFELRGDLACCSDVDRHNCIFEVASRSGRRSHRAAACAATAPSQRRRLPRSRTSLESGRASVVPARGRPRSRGCVAAPTRHNVHVGNFVEVKTRPSAGRERPLAYLGDATSASASTSSPQHQPPPRRRQQTPHDPRRFHVGSTASSSRGRDAPAPDRRRLDDLEAAPAGELTVAARQATISGCKRPVKEGLPPTPRASRIGRRIPAVVLESASSSSLSSRSRALCVAQPLSLQRAERLSLERTHSAALATDRRIDCSQPLCRTALPVLPAPTRLFPREGPGWPVIGVTASHP